MTLPLIKSTKRVKEFERDERVHMITQNVDVLKLKQPRKTLIVFVTPVVDGKRLTIIPMTNALRHF